MRKDCSKDHPNGVVYHPGRQQPYTAWLGGAVVSFHKRNWKAEERLEKERARRLPSGVCR